MPVQNDRPAAPAPEKTAVERQREELRARHGVRLVTEAEEGLAMHRLPAGTYGFAYAPAESAVPVFLKHTAQSFEVHKLADGSGHLVGFVSETDAAALEAGGARAEIRLYPDPYGPAARMVSLPFEEIVLSRRGPSRSEGNFVILHPAGD